MRGMCSRELYSDWGILGTFWVKQDNHLIQQDCMARICSLLCIFNTRGLLLTSQVPYTKPIMSSLAFCSNMSLYQQRI